MDSEHLSELTEEEYEVNCVRPQHKGFMKLDAKYLVPFFTRRFTQQVGDPRTPVWRDIGVSRESGDPSV